MIKILSLLTAVCAPLFLVTGCGGNGSDRSTDNALPAGTTLSIVLGAADTVDPMDTNDLEQLLGSAARSIILMAGEGMTSTITVDGEATQGAVYMINGNLQEGLFDLSCRWYTTTGNPRSIQMYGIHLKRGQLNGTFDYWNSSDAAHQFRGTKGTINYVN